jgi:hypothetical protein
MNRNLQLKTLRLLFILSVAIPLAIYELLKLFHTSDLLAFTFSLFSPLAFIVFDIVHEKKLDIKGIIGIVGFLVATLVLFLTRGDGLAFKAWQPTLSAGFGLILLLSVLTDRPIIELLGRWLKSSSVTEDKPTEGLSSSVRHQIYLHYTMIAGLILALHALITLPLALTLSSAKFILVINPINWGLILLLVLVIYMIRGRLQPEAKETKEK